MFSDSRNHEIFLGSATEQKILFGLSNIFVATDVRPIVLNCLEEVAATEKLNLKRMNIAAMSRLFDKILPSTFKNKTYVHWDEKSCVLL